MSVDKYVLSTKPPCLAYCITYIVIITGLHSICKKHGYFYSGIQDTFTWGYRILLQWDTGYFYRGIQDTVTGGYRILYQVDIGYFYGVLLQWDTGYFLQGDTGYFYRVIQDTYKFETRHRLIITFKKSAPPPIPIPHFS